MKKVLGFTNCVTFGWGRARMSIYSLLSQMFPSKALILFIYSGDQWCSASHPEQCSCTQWKANNQHEKQVTGNSGWRLLSLGHSSRHVKIHPCGHEIMVSHVITIIKYPVSTTTSNGFQKRKAGKCHFVLSSDTPEQAESKYVNKCAVHSMHISLPFLLEDLVQTLLSLLHQEQVS